MTEHPLLSRTNRFISQEIDKVGLLSFVKNAVAAKRRVKHVCAGLICLLTGLCLPVFANGQSLQSVTDNGPSTSNVIELTSYMNAKLLLNGGNSASQNGIQFGSVGGANNYYLYNGLFQGNTGFGIWDNTNYVHRLYITGAGNIGIGTIAPLSKFHIEGNTGLGAKLVVRGIAGIDPSLELGSTETGTALETGEGLVIKYINDVGETTLNNLYTLCTNAFRFQSAGADRLVIQNSGNVGIGTLDTKGYKLAVAGNAIAEQMTVKLQANWPDYVFKPSYRLRTLAEVKSYIDKNNHLPEMPSEQQVVNDGIDLGEMNRLLTKKVEELTLYLIEKDKEDKQRDLLLKHLQLQVDRLKRSK